MYIQSFHLLLFLYVCKSIWYLLLNLILRLPKTRGKDVYLSVSWFIKVIEELAIAKKFNCNIFLNKFLWPIRFSLPKKWTFKMLTLFLGRWLIFVPMLRSGWKKINRTLLPSTVREARVGLAPWSAPGLYTVGFLKKQR